MVLPPERKHPLYLIILKSYLDFALVACACEASSIIWKQRSHIFAFLCDEWGAESEGTCQSVCSSDYIVTTPDPVPNLRCTDVIAEPVSNQTTQSNSPSSGAPYICIHR